MDQSRRAVEAYWRSRMVDGVTSDEDKVAPVYKLEEICELLRTSHVSIVKEVSDYILKRLDHKSPLVKQKALRLIKYAVGKSGTEFRREMQRHSAVIRQLFHYKGHPDPLKGDALNKAVRDTAHETVSAIFANDDSKVVAPTEGIQKRIQGFGNTNYEIPSEEKKSFLSEVVGIGLSTIAAANSMRKSDGGNYKSPNLRRSLTTEMGSRDRYEGDEYHTESYASSGSSKNIASGGWGDDLRTTITSSAVTVDTSSGHSGIKSREERLLDTIVTSGGVRLQPTRDAIQVFLMEASKLDAVAMSHALEIKLQSPIWQVRMKACCVLEAILRKNDEQFSILTSYFSENRYSLVKCSELPQVSLREKATKVLNLLEGDPIYGTENAGEPSNAKPVFVPAVEMPDLIDTGEADDYGSGTSLHKDADNKNIGNVVASSSVSLVDDLLGDVPGAGLVGSSENKNEDPFADVSFHVTEDKQQDDIFSGLTVVNDKRSEHELKLKSSNESGLFDVFSGSDPNHPFLQEEPESSSSSNKKANLNDLMDGLSLNDTMQDNNRQPGASPFINGINRSNQKPMSDGALNGGLGSNSYFSVSPLQYNNVPQLQPNVMVFNPAFATQPMMNYGGAMGAAFVAHQQQQFLFENFGNLKPVYGQAIGSAADGAYSSSSPIPDIFQLSNNPLQSHASVVTTSKKEDTKAFDFISDHLAAARDPKRVL